MKKYYKQAMDSVMKSGQTGQVFYGNAMDADGAASSMAFLVGELEKADPTLLEPLTSITAPRDIDMKPGGGWVDTTSNVFVDYATSGDDEDSIIGSATTNVPVSQADMNKELFKVHTFSEILRVPLFDQEKLKQVGKNLTQILDDGIRLHFNKMLDRNVYTGISKTDTYGLINNPKVTAVEATDNQAGDSKLWENKTPDEIVADFNLILVQTWRNSEYDLSGMARHILIPPEKFGYISTRKVSEAGNISILEYVKQHNVATAQGLDIEILPSRWCGEPASLPGVGGTYRMVGYVKAANRVNIDLPVPLSRMMTSPNPQSASIETIFAAQFSQVKFLYNQCAAYVDGI